MKSTCCNVHLVKFYDSVDKAMWTCNTCHRKYQQRKRKSTKPYTTPYTGQYPYADQHRGFVPR